VEEWPSVAMTIAEQLKTMMKEWRMRSFLPDASSQLSTTGALSRYNGGSRQVYRQFLQAWDPGLGRSVTVAPGAHFQVSLTT
jgi:hypothetical protein